MTFPRIANSGDAVLVFLDFGGANISSVTDNLGNHYSSAVGPTNWGVPPAGRKFSLPIILTAAM
jgi:hypothetical protein